MAPYLPLFLLFFSILTPFSNGGRGREYEICSFPSSCGPVKDIHYPFWVEQTRPAFCGLPDFRLECRNPSHYPRIMDRGFRVRSINTSTDTIVIDRSGTEICYDLGYSTPKSLYNGTRFFSWGATIANLTLFLDCENVTTTTRFHDVSFTCSYRDGDASVYYLDEPAEVGRKCLENVTLLVSRRALNEFLMIENKTDKKLLSLLEAAAEMKYNHVNLAACSKCRNSGGVCGSSIQSPSKAMFECYYRYQDKQQHLVLILGLGIGGSILIIALVTFCYCKKPKFSHSNFMSRSLPLRTATPDLGKGSLYFGVPLFSYQDLEEATHNFDKSRQLGEGGFGRVYYGKLRDGREVAVKQLYEKSYRTVEQFMNEVHILTRLRHQNLVSLYGSTSPQCMELLLVYEYICNGTVADHLRGEKANTCYLSWAIRMRIAIETASALTYLHGSDVIHRDVKTKNILLDGKFGVKVADFGLSRLFPTDVTHVSTAPQGTPGYLDPEYHQCYQLTVKSDVYSFGVVLIELISSLPAVDMNRQKHEINLSNYAMNMIKRGAFKELVDPRLGFVSDFSVRGMTTSVAELAFQCLQHNKEFRPAMDEVLEVLKRIESADYNEHLEAKGKEERSHTKVVRKSPTEDDDHAQMLTCMYRHNHQQMNPPSPNSVVDRWGSRSTTASGTRKQARWKSF